MSESAASAEHVRRLSLGLTIGALGVVFGDIGTSPLYALRECFRVVPPTPENILGVLSLIFWVLISVVCLKYVTFMLQADNRGEGGVLALLSLSHRRINFLMRTPRRYLIYLGVFCAALLYGDGAITPAISVLSAVEGLKVATPVFEPYVLPLTVIILVALFVFQKRGTGAIGALFGPIMLVWFLTLGLLGAFEIRKELHVFSAINPVHAIDYFVRHPLEAFITLGSVFLVATGGEALYANMGHFGRRPIRYGWYCIVFPGLLLNYFGQGALLLRHSDAINNPFYYLSPDWLLLPLVFLATCASVIASQAIISGVFSITSQAIKLGFLPRIDIKHTSSEEIGQIYVSRINWMLLVITLWLVLEFGSPSRLAAAYGIAISLAMCIDSVLVFLVIRNIWKWNLLGTMLLVGFFLCFDLSFLAANSLKIVDGGWVPLVIGGAIFTVMITWREGRRILRERLREILPPFEVFVHDIPEKTPLRVSGTAIYMNSHADLAPPALLHNLKHNKVVHELILIVSVEVDEAPYVQPDQRISLKQIRDGIFGVNIRYGFLDTMNVPRALMRCKDLGLDFDVSKATFFLGRETLLATARPGMAIWREELFSFMSRNAQKASRFFGIRADQVVEIGFEVEL